MRSRHARLLKRNMPPPASSENQHSPVLTHAFPSNTVGRRLRHWFSHRAARSGPLDRYYNTVIRMQYSREGLGFAAFHRGCPGAVLEYSVSIGSSVAIVTWIQGGRARNPF